jgi:hypothetical protein
VTDTTGNRNVVTLSEETDTVLRYPGAEESLYQIDIVSGDFRVTEIGPLIRDTLRTATATVSDEQFRVLEEYVFDMDTSCKALGFTKSVRNPDPGLFKACVTNCNKSSD